MAHLGLRSFGNALVFLSLLSVLAPRAAVADRATPASKVEHAPADSSDEAQAEALADQADAAVGEDRPSDAADLYGRAWAVYKNPDYICNRGTLLISSGRYRDAAESLYTCKSASTGSNGAVNAVVQFQFDKARTEVGAIRITTNVPGAAILVDNKPVGTAPLDAPVFVEPGRHVVEARAEGFMTDAAMVNSTKGSWRNVALTLERPIKPGLLEPIPPESEEGTTRSDPHSPSPHESPKPRPAPSAASNASGAVVGNQGSTSSTGAAIFVLGGAALTAALGVGALFIASERRDDAEQLEHAITTQNPEHACSLADADPRCGTPLSQRHDASLFTAIGAGTLAISSGFAAFAVYEIVSGHHALPQTAPRVAITVSPNGGQAVVLGHF